MNSKNSFKLIDLLIAGVIAVSVNVQSSYASSEVPISPNQPISNNGNLFLPIECSGISTDGMTPNSWAFAMNFSTSQASPKGCMVTMNAQSQVSKQTVQCLNNGNVQIGNGQATFSGNNYLECPLNLNNYFAGLPASVSYNNLTMEARYMTMWNSGSSSGENPVFTHPSVRYALPVDWAAGIVGLTTRIGNEWLGWQYSGNLPAADQIKTPEGWIARSELRKQSNGTLNVQHISSNPKDGAKWSGGNATPPSPINFQTNATIFIGRANTLSTPLYLQGTLDQVMMKHIE